MAAQNFDRRSIPPIAVESVWTAADGHPLRRIDWRDAQSASRPKGSILFFPGRGDAYEKYLETLQQWNDAGWQVTAADWRGQAGSGRLGGDAITGHIDDYSIWIDDLAGFWTEWKQNTPSPHILAGHSMGGHLVLRGVVEKRVDPDAVFLSAPMLGYFGNVLPRTIMHGIVKIIRMLRGATTPAWKWSEKPGEIPLGRINLLTHDKQQYDDELWWRKHRPELVVGPGSWGWLERGYASMEVIFAPDGLESVTTPVLLVATSNDKLVDFKAIKDAARRLPHAELLTFGKEAHHELLREKDHIRDRVMAGIDDFLGRVAPVR